MNQNTPDIAKTDTPSSTPKIIDLPPRLGAALPVIHVRVTITRFRNLLLPLEHGAALSGYTMKVLTKHPNVAVTYKKGVGGERIQQKLKVRNEGAILRFMITDETRGRIYRPMAITFTRTRRKKPRRAVYWSSGNQMGVHAPFSSLELNGSMLQFIDTLPPLFPTEEKKDRRFKYYESSILIQRHLTGATGLFSFCMENEDDGSVANEGDDDGTVRNDNEYEPEEEEPEPPENDPDDFVGE
jgi:hypothetical protein